MTTNTNKETAAMETNQQSPSRFVDQLAYAWEQPDLPVSKATGRLFMALNSYVTEHISLIGKLEWLQRDCELSVALLNEGNQMYASGVVQSRGTDIDKACNTQAEQARLMDDLCAIAGIDRVQFWQHVAEELQSAISKRNERINGKGK